MYCLPALVCRFEVLWGVNNPNLDFEKRRIDGSTRNEKGRDCFNPPSPPSRCIPLDAFFVCSWPTKNTNINTNNHNGTSLP